MFVLNYKKVKRFYIFLVLAFCDKSLDGKYIAVSLCRVYVSCVIDR